MKIVWGGGRGGGKRGGKASEIIELVESKSIQRNGRIEKAAAAWRHDATSERSVANANWFRLTDWLTNRNSCRWVDSIIAYCWLGPGGRELKSVRLEFIESIGGEIGGNWLNHWLLLLCRSRKRRSSPSIGDVMMDEEEDLNLDLMDECAAAMVLMRLSCSPHSPRWEGTNALIWPVGSSIFAHPGCCFGTKWQIFRMWTQSWQLGRATWAAAAAAVLSRGAEAPTATRLRTLPPPLPDRRAFRLRVAS